MITTGTDTGFIERELYILRRGDKEISLSLYAEYDVEFTIERHNHYGYIGDDTCPDCNSLELVNVNFIEVTAYDDEGCEIKDFQLSAEEKSKIEKELKDMAKDNYYEYGTWGRN